MNSVEDGQSNASLEWCSALYQTGCRCKLKDDIYDKTRSLHPVSPPEGSTRHKLDVPASAKYRYILRRGPLLAQRVDDGSGRSPSFPDSMMFCKVSNWHGPARRTGAHVILGGRASCGQGCCS